MIQRGIGHAENPLITKACLCSKVLETCLNAPRDLFFPITSVLRLNSMSSFYAPEDLREI